MEKPSTSASYTMSLIDNLQAEIAVRFATERKELNDLLDKKQRRIVTLEIEVERLETEINKLHREATEQKRESEKTIHALIHNHRLEIDTLNKEITTLKMANTRQMSTSPQSLTISEDPRIRNRPLPQESKITYEFGARAYISDAYPNYVWRNGHWYKITDELKFVSMTHEEIKKILLTNIYTTDIMRKIPFADKSYTIDDTFAPIIYKGIRYFIRCLLIDNNNKITFSSINQNNTLLIYNPATQTVCDKYYSRFVNWTYDSFVYEDTKGANPNIFITA